MPESGDDQTIWWGDFTFAEEEAGCWHVGPSTLWIYRFPREWRIVHVEHGEVLSEASTVQLPIPEDERKPSLADVEPEATVRRFSFKQTAERLSVLPVLADRPVVVRPESPLYVSPDEAAALFVSTPLWLRLEAGTPPRLLEEIPSFRPSDTWFGPSTTEGELCYATRTAGRLHLETLPILRYRAITRILIRNRAHDAMLVERVQLPVQYLSLFQASNGLLWTQAVRLERGRDGGLAGLHIEDRPPAEAEGAVLVREPRQMSRSGLIGRTFSTLFHKIREA